MKSKYPKQIQKLSECCDVILEKENKIFWIDEENQNYIEDLFDYFFNKPEFEKNGRLLTKGILTIGNVGSGKSMIFEEISKHIPNSNKNYFSCINCDKISEEWSNKDSLIVKKAKFTLTEQGNLNNIYLNDIGDELPVNVYGINLEPIERIIIHRNLGWIKRGSKTHGSMNLSMSKFKERYGERAESRLKHMCNILYLGAKAYSKDRRIKWK